MSSDRRRAPRYQFIARAEMTELASRTKFKAQTGDLSMGGCFIDMMNPLPQDAWIRLTIFHEHRRFVALGKVVFVFPRLGMGVAFAELEPPYQVILEGWLADLEHSRRAIAAAVVAAAAG